MIVKSLSTSKIGKLKCQQSVRWKSGYCCEIYIYMKTGRAVQEFARLQKAVIIIIYFIPMSSKPAVKWLGSFQKYTKTLNNFLVFREFICAILGFDTSSVLYCWKHSNVKIWIWILTKLGQISWYRRRWSCWCASKTWYLLLPSLWSRKVCTRGKCWDSKVKFYRDLFYRTTHPGWRWGI